MSIPLSGGRYGYGWILSGPLVLFFDSQSRVLKDPLELVDMPSAFRVWATHDAIRDGEWIVLGNVAVPKDKRSLPALFKQDRLSGRLSITHDGSDEVPATLEQIRGLECAAVWNSRHIVERLEDHFAGRPNRWVESMRPKAGSR